MKIEFFSANCASLDDGVSSGSSLFAKSTCFGASDNQRIKQRRPYEIVPLKLVTRKYSDNNVKVNQYTDCLLHWF